MRFFLLLMISTLTGCFLAHENAPDTPSGLERSERFVGDWEVVTDAGRALFASVTAYRFSADGTLEELFIVEGSYRDGEAGQFVFDGNVCFFGNRWWSEGSDRLFIESECTDGSVTVAEILFPNPESQNSGWTEATLVAPAVEGAWELDGTITRCPPEGCRRE
ncbi:MAG: hypothetical protein AAGF12_10410 [Myxococcota bacterium]